MPLIHTLRGRLIIILGVFLLIIMTAVSPLIFNKMKELILSKHIESAKRLTHTGTIPLTEAMLSNVIGKPLPNEYFVKSLDILRSTSEEQILFAYFINNAMDSIIFSSAEPDWININPFRQFEKAIYKDSNHWILQSIEPINISTKQWGYLVLGFNADNVLREVKDTFFQVYFVAGMIILFTLFIVYIIAEFLTKRLNLLSQAVDSFDFNQFDEGLPEGDDEIGRLADNFSKLRKRLIKSRQELRDSERNLFHTEKLAAVGRLAAGMAHEINNPLTGIRHAINLILEDPDNKQNREEYLALIDEALMKIEIVISKLLGFARRKNDDSVNASFNDAIHTVIKLLDYSIKSKPIKIELKLDKNLRSIKCPPNLLDEIAMNIILNAVDAVPKNGKIMCSTYNEDDVVVVEIKDNGHGISSTNIDNVFEPFFTTKEVQKGTGLGLFVTREIVNSLNGTIEFVSKENNGAKFSIKIPGEKV